MNARTCEIGDCERTQKSNGLCHTHYRHVRQFGAPRPIRAITPRSDSTVRDEAGRKRCVRCNEWRDESEFYLLNQTRDGLNSHCKSCMKNGNLFRLFGLTPEKYDNLLESQGGGCAICTVRPVEGDRRFPVDHDRACCPGDKSCGECVRGVLCPGCNSGIGMFHENVETIEAAIRYVEAHR